jgi:hypothetical protein
MAPNKEQHEITLAGSLRIRHLLLLIEAQQETCCLRVISPEGKSRAAILVYRGQVIACVFGKKQSETLFGREAHIQALAELAQSQNVVDSYSLDEELVLSAASLFHGSVVDTQSHMSAIEAYQVSIYSMLKDKEVGCIVVNNTHDFASFMTYTFDGKILGLYSFAQGWIEPTVEAGLECLLATQGAKVIASIIDARNEDEAAQFCFSLTGLNEANSYNGPLLCTDYIPSAYPVR